MVEQKESKDTGFLNEIFDLCVDCVDNGVVPSVEVCGMNLWICNEIMVVSGPSLGLGRVGRGLGPPTKGGHPQLRV